MLTKGHSSRVTTKNETKHLFLRTTLISSTEPHIGL